MVKFLFAFAMVVLPVNAGAQTEHTVAALSSIRPGCRPTRSRKRRRSSWLAGLTGLNGALNFNGFRDGGLTLTVPLGWTVVMHFRITTECSPFRRSHPGHPSLPTGPVAPLSPRFHAPAGARTGVEQTDDLRFIADKGGPT